MPTYEEFLDSLKPQPSALGQPPPADGRWLTTEGPYSDYVAAYCNLNPSLRTPDDKNRWFPLGEGQARVAMLELEQGKRTRRRDFHSAAELSTHFRHSSEVRASQSSCIYIMEGLALDFIAALGNHFLMDPTFFMAQERTTRWGLSFEGSKNPSELPALMDSERLLSIRYYEPRHFNEIKSFSMWCARTSRNISVTRNTRPDLYDLRCEPVGIVHRKCSFWSRKLDGNGWDAVILCDPPVEHVHMQMDVSTIDADIRSKYSRWMPQPPLENQPASNDAFSGGYLDFIKHPSFGHNVPKGPPRISMLEDLCFCWTEHKDKIEDMLGPAFLTFFMHKIVASHYMQLLEFARANVANLEFKLSRRDSLKDIHIPWIGAAWSDLQAWSWRFSEYAEQVEAILLSLGGSLSVSSDQNQNRGWRNCEKDFQYILYRLKTLRTRVDGFMTSITGLAGIAGNRHALHEAKRSLRETMRIKTLSLLGMVFLPLGFCTGLFSMNEKYLPGTPSFWMYLAVAIPLIVAVFMLTFFVGLGYDSDGEWKVETFRSNITIIRWRRN